MAVVHFGSGAQVTVTPEEYRKLFSRITDAAIRVWDNRRGTLIMLSPSAIDFIVYNEEDARREVVLNPEVREIPNIKTPDKGPSLQERERAVLDSIQSKADCTHENTMVLYYQEVSKKDHSTWRRYFKQCSFCGFKSKFISADDLTDEEKNNAVVCQET